MSAGIAGSMAKRLMGHEERYFGKTNRAAAGRFVAGRLKALTRHEALFVAGELSPDFYESPEFKGAVLAILKSSSPISIKIACGKRAELIEKQNPFLWDLASKGRISIYITPTRPKYHFICIDGRSLFLEANHEPGQPCETYFMEDAEEVARTYKDKFNSLIESGRVQKLQN